MTVHLARAWFTALDWAYVVAWQLYGLVTSSDTEQYLRGPARRRNVVIMLPGVYEPWRFMKPLSDLLHADGYHVYVIAGLGYNTGRVPAAARIVRDFIEEHDIPSAVVVAHSKGGLIGKYLLANFNADQRLKHVIAINSPFEGSIYANLAPVRSVRIFSTRDEVIRTLRLNRLVNRSVTSVYSVFDANIPRGSHLDGATNVRLDIIGHFRVVGSRVLHEKLLAILERIEAGTRSPEAGMVDATGAESPLATDAAADGGQRDQG